MTEPTYFLVNHSRKVFWFFGNKDSLLEILNFAEKNIKDWKITDEVCIESEYLGYGIMPRLVTDKGYKEIIYNSNQTL